MSSTSQPWDASNNEHNDKQVLLPKVLVITRTFFPKEGGIEEYVYNRCLQDPGQVTVLASSCVGDRQFDAEQTFTVYRWWVPNWLPENAIGSLLKQLLNMLGAFWMALRLNARHQYDAIEWCHGYDFPALWALTYLLPAKFYMYLHGNDLLCPLRSPLLKQPFAATLQRLNGIICNSSFTEQYLQQYFQLVLKTMVINPTVRPSKFGIELSAATLAAKRHALREKYGISPTAIVLLSVGRLVKRKGVDRVIRTLPTLLEAKSDVHYLICGRGPMEPELKTLTATLGLENRVHFAGFVPDHALAEHYAACDIFTLLTFFDDTAASIEGFGIVYAEAGFFGKPVVATNIGGVVDAVHDQVNGILVEPDNSEQAIDALSRLCRDPELREQLGNQGIEMANRLVPHRLAYTL